MTKLAAPAGTAGSASSDYFDDDDPAFLQALQEAVLPGDVETSSRRNQHQIPNTEDAEPLMPPPSQLGLKRPRSPYSEHEEWEDGDGDAVLRHEVLSSIDEKDGTSSYLSSDVYGASRFGGFGEYMSRKRAKLQLQNGEINPGGDDSGQGSQIFRGLKIYINGWTEPSVQDLRQLIVQHGGTYHPYLDKKSLVTHIITCSLTPAKIREFKHMKVVKPDWLVQSAEAGVLLPWHDFLFKPGERAEESQGKKVAQMSLFDGFVSQSSSKRPLNGPTSTSAPKEGGKAEVQAGPSSTPEQPVASTSSGPSTPPRTPTKPASTPSPPLYITDPSTPEQAKRIPGYSAYKSNPHAERAMADPAWRAAHTSVAPDFIEGYYRNSRLHHLSTWKAELRSLVAEALECAENGRGEGGTDPAAVKDGDGGDEAVEKVVRENMGARGWASGADDGVSMRGAQLAMRPADRKGKGKEKAVDDKEAGERVIMHCDFDSFFVSAGLVDRPHLRGKPVVVCHSQGNQGGQSSTSEIASASYEAREFGIKSGMSLQQARQLCPTVLTMPYEFQRYKQFSLQFYTILMAHADDLQAVSVDEALIDVTSSVRRIKMEIAQSQDPTRSPADPTKEFAEAIRAQIRKATGCEVSIGISHNIMLARLASRRAKPAGSYHLLQTELSDFLAPLDIDNLHGFGYAARQKAEEKLGSANLGVLAQKSKAILCDALGKGMGETLYKAIRGVDDKKLESDKPRKSVSCDINYGIRFENNEQAEAFVYQLAEEVARRLDSIEMRGRSLTLKILKRDPAAPVEAPKFLGHGICDSFTKQAQLLAPGGGATSDDKIIGECAWRLLKGYGFDPKELRGIGIQIQKLEKAAAGEVEQGQAILPFKRVESPKKPQIVVQPPSQDDDEVVEIPKPNTSVAVNLDLPSFSQVDMSVFEALPPEVRAELESEYKRRSTTPAAAPVPVRSRSPSAPVDSKLKITARGNTNVKRITQQLAPKARSSVSPAKNKLFAKRDGPSSLHVSDVELRKLGLDPEVFAMLPVDLQREQLAVARQTKASGGSGLAFGGPRKVLKPKSRVRRSNSPSVPYYRPPPPKAKHPEPPFLKQQGKTKGEKLYFTETDDVQRVIETWVSNFLEHPPNEKDVDFFAKFLVQCVDGSRSTDTGVEKAVAVIKWWLILLRRHFASWEDSPESRDKEDERDCQYTSESVGRAWWAAFREVKGRMDAVLKRKFGGCLSLR